MFNSRTDKRVANNLGIVKVGDKTSGKRYRKCRKDILDRYDKYMECRQYDDLAAWNAGRGDPDCTLRLQDRKPLVNYNLAQRIVNTVTSKLIGQNVWPEFRVEDDPEGVSTYFLKLVIRKTMLQSRMIPAIKRLCINGSSFVRFYFVGSKVKIEVVNTKYCYPVFDKEGELESIEIRYTFKDEEDKDAKGNPKEKWHRMILGKMEDVLFDNPEFKPDEEPVFVPVETAKHKYGFVQGEWFRTDENHHDVDGPSLIGDSLTFIDNFNYSMSQALQATNYNQEPQLTFNGMTEAEIEEFRKGSDVSWNLGKEGKAAFLETNLAAVETGNELRNRMVQCVQNVARTVFLDPDKIVGSAQSAKAMEVLHGPLVDLVLELRPQIEPSLVSLVTKIATSMLVNDAKGVNEVMEIPDEYRPDTLDVTLLWPPVFPQTMEDLRAKVAVASQASTANLISRATLTAWLAKDFGVEDVEAEILKVDNQKVLNPFGAF